LAATRNAIPDSGRGALLDLPDNGMVGSEVGRTGPHELEEGGKVGSRSGLGAGVGVGVGAVREIGKTLVGQRGASGSSGQCALLVGAGSKSGGKRVSSAV
jgi:hypothetical protein